MVPVRRALRLVIEGKAEIVESDAGDVVRSERLTLPKPAIIRLVKFVHVPRRFRRQVTNTFLFARDGYRCQYCHRGQSELRHRECLTRDHLIPLSRGGDNEWTNVVTACSACNTRKGNHLPAGVRHASAGTAARAALRASLLGGAPTLCQPRPSTSSCSTARRRCGRWAGRSSSDVSADVEGWASGPRAADSADPARRSRNRVAPRPSASPSLPCPVADLAQVALQKPLQLVQIGVRQRRDLQTTPRSSSGRARPASRSPDRQRPARRSARRSWRSGAPAPGSPDESEQGVLVQQRLVPKHHVPFGLPLEGVEPGARAIARPRLDNAAAPAAPSAARRASGRRSSRFSERTTGARDPLAVGVGGQADVSRTGWRPTACAAAGSGREQSTRRSPAHRSRPRRRSSAIGEQRTRSGAAVSRGNFTGSPSAEPLGEVRADLARRRARPRRRRSTREEPESG